METLTLQDFNLDVEPGQTVALVRASGAGKTTVLQLLLRFYEPQSGRITLHGQDIQDMSLAALRSQMALVPQEANLFAASALDNIRYGMPGADEAAVRQLAQAAFADDFIQALPQGYETFLGKKGVRLSGGQRQRISIARAMLRNPPILLLDEATSALDAEIELMVQLALERAMQGRTTIVIAHRLDTAKHADRMIVLDKGRILEEGSHSDLLTLGRHYAYLASLRFLG